MAIYHIEIASQPDSKMMIFSNKKLLQKIEQYQKETEGYLNKTLPNPDNRVSTRQVFPSGYYRQKSSLRKEANPATSPVLKRGTPKSSVVSLTRAMRFLSP